MEQVCTETWVSPRFQILSCLASKKILNEAVQVFRDAIGMFDKNIKYQTLEGAEEVRRFFNDGIRPLLKQSQTNREGIELPYMSFLRFSPENESPSPVKKSIVSKGGKALKNKRIESTNLSGGPSFSLSSPQPFAHNLASSADFGSLLEDTNKSDSSSQAETMDTIRSSIENLYNAFHQDPQVNKECATYEDLNKDFENTLNTVRGLQNTAIDTRKASALFKLLTLALTLGQKSLFLPRSVTPRDRLAVSTNEKAAYRSKASIMYVLLYNFNKS